MPDQIALPGRSLPGSYTTPVNGPLAANNDVDYMYAVAEVYQYDKDKGMPTIRRPSKDSIAAPLVAVLPGAAFTKSDSRVIQAAMFEDSNKPVLAQIHPDSAYPAVGDQVGTKKDSWCLYKGNTGFIVTGLVSDATGRRLVYVRPFAKPGFQYFWFEFVCSSETWTSTQFDYRALANEIDFSSLSVTSTSSSVDRGRYLAYACSNTSSSSSAAYPYIGGLVTPQSGYGPAVSCELSFRNDSDEEIVLVQCTIPHPTAIGTQGTAALPVALLFDPAGSPVSKYAAPAGQLTRYSRTDAVATNFRFFLGNISGDRRVESVARMLVIDYKYDPPF